MSVVQASEGCECNSDPELKPFLRFNRGKNKSEKSQKAKHINLICILNYFYLFFALKIQKYKITPLL